MIASFTGGNITLEDLESYDVPIEPPLEIKLENGDYTLLVPQPPSSGIVLGHILKILDGKNILLRATLKSEYT